MIESDPRWLLVLVAGLAGLALLAYVVRALDWRGAVASFALGLLVAVVGGVGWLLLMALFTLIGFAATHVGRPEKEARDVLEAREGERGLGNVLANGAAAGLAALALLVVDEPAARLAFATALAAVTADTLASEIGSLARRARRILPPFPVTPAGVNGSVSWLGQFAALAGAAAIAAAAVPLVGIEWRFAWIPALAGFAGCQIDSVLGATLERDMDRDGPLSKGDVNFVSSALPAFVVLVLAALA